MEIEFNHSIKQKILNELIHCEEMETGELRKNVYGRRRARQFWKFIDSLEDEGWIEIKPNKIVLTTKGKERFLEALRKI